MSHNVDAIKPKKLAVFLSGLVELVKSKQNDGSEYRRSFMVIDEPDFFGL